VQVGRLNFRAAKRNFPSSASAANDKDSSQKEHTKAHTESEI